MNRLFFVSIFLSFLSFGQRTNFWSSSNAKPMVWIHYENDLFAARDAYYSQGIAVNYKTEVMSQSYFFKLKNSRQLLGFGLEHQVFTPSSIASNSILFNDRPYGATLRLDALFETLDTIRGNTIGWGISLGYIGPEAGGKQMQTGIHKATNNFLPLGWEHQLGTGLLMDGVFHGSQRLIDLKKMVLFDVIETVSLGASKSDAQLDGKVQLGYSGKNASFYVIAMSGIRAVGYDASLQGALISRTSEYRIANADVTRFVFENEIGFGLQIRKVTFNYWYRFQSKVFEQGVGHVWGGLRFAVAI